MNKKGHVALAVASGTLVVFALPSLSSISNIMPAVLLIAGAAVGGLVPDLDHKTGTISQLIQFSAARRKLLKTLSLFSLLVGVFLIACGKWFDGPVDRSIEWLISSAPLWIGTGIICGLAAKLRVLILSGVGILLLLAYGIYDWHWVAAVAGCSFLIVPIVKHRGIIHTPEFAALLTYGLYLFATQLPDMLQGLIHGFIVGWWAHLLGDCFGREGIQSLIIPKVKIALKLFVNGGSTERWITRFCWSASFFLWIVLFISRSNIFTQVSLFQ
ncbi:metal-dependent hydrolase [Paenibacillus solani]|uniref:metal-dependent hydrolase n=1 Tax=Paenibacillus solani TaxID=1705565 RepID=UPI003D2E3CDF